MPKNPNSRPDIQVLEDRVVRLKSQVSQYADIRLYKVTKDRLSKVCSELEECISILNSVVGRSNNMVSSTSISAFTDSPSDTLSEFSVDSDSDLSDTLSFYRPPQASNSNSPKVIVKNYATRIQQCADEVGCSSGIIQVNQFCQLLNSWYQTRFAPSPARNPNFRFKATRIWEWIDLLIVSAGKSLHDGMFPSFLSDVQAWIDRINVDKELVWVLPYGVMQIEKSLPKAYTLEAIVIERIVKPSLFNESFYIQNRHTIEQNYKSAFGVSDDDLKMDALIQQCPKFILTSSFDSSKYSSEG